MLLPCWILWSHPFLSLELHTWSCTPTSLNSGFMTADRLMCCLLWAPACFWTSAHVLLTFSSFWQWEKMLFKHYKNRICQNSWHKVIWFKKKKKRGPEVRFYPYKWGKQRNIQSKTIEETILQLRYSVGHLIVFISLSGCRKHMQAQSLPLGNICCNLLLRPSRLFPLIDLSAHIHIWYCC